MLESEILERLTRVREGALRLGSSPSELKNRVLEKAARTLISRRR